MYAQRCVVVGIMLTTLGGCVTVGIGPERAYPVDEQISDIRSYEIDTKLPPRALTNELDRNNFVTERMFAMDLEYNIYFSKLTNEAQTGNAALDITALALSTAATGFASEVTKTALSAGATVVNGTRTAINQDVLVSHTIQILQSQMETSRNLIRKRIEGNLKACLITDYTAWQALTDLEDYYRAGTLPGALEALAAAAGNSAQQSKDVKNGSTQISTTPATASAPSQGRTSNGGSVMNLAPGATDPAPKCQVGTAPGASAAARLLRQR